MRRFTDLKCSTNPEKKREKKERRLTPPLCLARCRPVVAFAASGRLPVNAVEQHGQLGGS